VERHTAKRVLTGRLLFGSLILVPLLLGSRASFGAAPAGFADNSFQQLWARTDQPVADGQVQRSWYWGPQPGITASEPYSGSKSGTRLVQYFDKARMEVNNPDGDRSSEWFVTTGLLVVEMVSGKQQVGDKEFVPKRAAEIAVGGDGLQADPDAPTYTSFRPVASLSGPGANCAPNLTGQTVTATINRAGQVSSDPAKGLYPGAKLAVYSDVLGHNIPQAMWDFLNLKGPIEQNGKLRTDQTIANWVFVLGYPITESYWSRLQIGGVYYDALIQLYERRSLTYVPSFPKGWQVQMGNVGQHYYRWLYGGPLPTPLVQFPTPTLTPLLPTSTLTPSSIVPPPTGTPAPSTPTRVPTSVPTSPPGSATPTSTVPVVPTEPPGGLVLSVTPGAGPPDGQFTFVASGLAPGEGVHISFTDPNGTVVYPAGSNNGQYSTDGSGTLSITLVPAQAFPTVPLGNWLFEVRSDQSGLDGIIGFVLR
jgi:hypothetical protein